MAHDELLRIDYNLERVLTGEPDDNQLDVWAAALTRGTLRDEDITWQEAATATLYGLDPHRNALLGESPFDVADAYSADAAYYYEHVFEASGELLADVQDEFEWVDARALFLHDVQVPGPLRRRGYGSLLAADAILTLAPHGTAVFAHPGPTDLQSEDPQDVRRFEPRQRTHGSWRRWASCHSVIGSGYSTCRLARRWTPCHGSAPAFVHEHAGACTGAGGAMAAEWPPRILRGAWIRWDGDGLHERVSAGQRHSAR